MKTLTVPEPLKEKDFLIPDNAVSLYQWYGLVNPELEIINFIEKHNLWGFLFEAHWEIKRVFGDDIVLELELHYDPEENFEELFIVIKTRYTSKEARKLVDKLGEQWFLDIIEKTQGKLCITEEPL